MGSVSMMSLLASMPIGLQLYSVLAAPAKAGIKNYYIEQEPPFVAMTAMEAIEVDYRYLRAI